MTTKAQLRKAALGLPEVEEIRIDGLPAYLVDGRTFAALSADGQVRLRLDEDTIRRTLKKCTVSQTHLPDADAPASAIPLAEVNGMELNNLVYKAWLNQAPTGLADAARAAARGEAPAGEDALPASIGKPATRALLLEGIGTLGDAAARSEAELLALHGVGPRAIRLLGEALEASGRRFRSED